MTLIFLDLAELEDHHDRLRKLENQSKLANLVSGGGDLGEDKLSTLLKAINDIKPTAKLIPDNTNAYNLMSMLHYRMGEEEESLM